MKQINLFSLNDNCSPTTEYKPRYENPLIVECSELNLNDKQKVQYHELEKRVFELEQHEKYYNEQLNNLKEEDSEQRETLKEILLQLANLKHDLQAFQTNFEAFLSLKEEDFQTFLNEKEQQYQDLVTLVNSLQATINTMDVYKKSESDNRYALKTSTVNLTGNQTIAGVKNFTSTPQVSSSNVLTETTGYKKSEVDGKLNDLGLGESIKTLGGGNNLNNIINTGYYWGGSLLNSPLQNDNSLYLSVLRINNSRTLQLVNYLGNGSYYYRVQLDGVWQTWKQLATTDTTVNLTGNQTITGVKNFTSTPQVNGVNIATQSQIQALSDRITKLGG